MKIVFIFFLIFFSFANLFPENKITNFEGGFYNTEFSFFSSSLTGVSAGLANMGNTISSINAESGILSLNPAGLGYLRQPEISTDFLIPFSIKANSIYDINEQLKNIIDERDDIEGTLIYPEVEFKGGQAGGIKRFATCFPLKGQGTFGVCYHTPLLIDFRTIGNGGSGVLEAASSDDTTRVTMGMELFSNLRADFNEVDFGYGNTIGENMAAGIGLIWLSARIEGDLTAMFEGVIRRAGDAQINQPFNDPTVEFRDTLNDSIRLDLKTDIFTGIIGFNYNHSDWAFDSVLKIPARSKFDGYLKIVQHSLGVLDEEALLDPELELLDQNLLELSKPTYTNRTAYESTEIELRYPGKIALSAALQKDFLDFVFSYEKSLGNLSVRYRCNVNEDGREKIDDNFEDYERFSQKDYTYGFNPKHTFKFGLGFKKLYKSAVLSFGGQLIIADQVLTNIKDKDGNPVKPNKNMLIPTFTTGFDVSITNDLTLDVSMLAFPEHVARTSLTFRF